MAEHQFCFDCGRAEGLTKAILVILDRAGTRGWLAASDRKQLDIYNNDLGFLLDGMLATAPGRPMHPYEGMDKYEMQFERAQDAADDLHQARLEEAA